MSLRMYIRRGLEYVVKGVPIYQVNADVRVLSPSEMLAGRTAIVTGGTSGIGMEIAKALLGAGAEVVITGRHSQKVEDACAQIKKSTSTEKIHGIVLNNLKTDEFPARFDEILNAVSKNSIDILVNNAGLVGGDIRNCKEKEYEEILDTNLKGTFFLSQLVAKYMRDNEIKGNILNVGSSSCLRPAISAYTLSKWESEL